jgi:hypothetical protein
VSALGKRDDSFPCWVASLWAKWSFTPVANSKSFFGRCIAYLSYRVGLAVVDLFSRVAYTSRDVACGAETLPLAPT